MASIFYKKKHKYRNWLITGTILQFLFLGFLIAYFSVYYNIEPFPEKKFFYQLDDRMIASGQAVTLGIIYFCIIGLIVSCTSNVIFGLFLCYKILAHKLLYIKTANSKFKFVLQVIWFTIFVCLYLILGIFLVIYLWVIYAINKEGYFNFVVIQYVNKPMVTWKEVMMRCIACIAPFIFCGSLFLTIVNCVPKMNYNYKFSKESAIKAVTLSNNKPNVIQLYFDRATGVAWNMILKIDELLNNEQSFIHQFPEFTSYISSISLSGITKISNPTIYSGTLFHPLINDIGTTNVFSNLPNSKITVDDWYYNAFKNEAEMYMEQGVKNISISNSPYFRTTYALSKEGSTGDMYSLQKWFDKDNLTNVNTTINSKICAVKGNISLKFFDNEVLYDELVIKNLPNWMDFQKSESGSFLQFFSQQTHEPYVLRDKNGNAFITETQNDFFNSMYLAIKEIQDIFTRMKNEPFYDSSGNQVGSVYDHTLIYVISDHGFYLERIPRYSSIMSYLVSNKVMTKVEKESLLKFHQYFYNPVIMIKPFKYNKSNVVVNDQNNFNFNIDQIISLGDLQRIVEIYLNQYNEWNPTSKICSKEMLNKINGKELRDYLSHSIMLNPLDSSKNSIKNGYYKDRQFLIANPNSWRYLGTDINFSLFDLGEFKMDPASKSIFNNKNFKIKPCKTSF